MSEIKKQQGYVKTENTLLIAFVALWIGFAGGVVFGVYKSGSVAAPQGGMPPAENASKEQHEHAVEIEALKKTTRENPEEIESWIQLGHLYFDTDRFKEAIAAYETSLKIKPDNPDVLTDLGIMYRRDGNPKEAVAKFDQAMTIDPSHQVSRFNKGIVLMHDLKDTKAAMEAWRELIKLNPEAKTPNGQMVKDFITQIERQSAQ